MYPTLNEVHIIRDFCDIGSVGACLRDIIFGIIDFCFTGILFTMEFDLHMKKDVSSSKLRFMLFEISMKSVWRFLCVTIIKVLSKNIENIIFSDEIFDV